MKTSLDEEFDIITRSPIHAVGLSATHGLH